MCIRDRFYPWVEVRSPVFATATRGWLLQQQGGTLLLLSRSGVDLVTLGDTPFTVSNAFGASVEVTPEGLRASAPQVTQFPRFKEETGAQEGNAAGRAGSPSSSTGAAVPKEQPAGASAAVRANQRVSAPNAPTPASAQR